MKSLSRILFALLLLIPINHALAVEETVVDLPNDLGQAVIYTREDGQQAGPGVLVIHEWWGLNDYARGRAKMLAEAGFTAIAVDMYGHGQVASHPDNAKAFMDQALAEPEKMNARFNAARSLLAEQHTVDPDRLFAMGYCFGCAVVLNQARMGAELAGVASFHGSLVSDIQPEPGSINARILVAHGGADPFVPAEQAAQFMSDMISAGADLTFINYPTAVHGFTNPAASEKGEEFGLPLAYDQQADEDSWAQLLEFIQQ